MITPLLKIELLHSYFSSGIFENCQVTADENTQKIINQYQLLSSMENGIFTLYKESNDIPAFLRYLNNKLGEGSVFNFFLIFNQNEFVFSTDLPHDWVGQVKLNSKCVTSNKIENGLQTQLVPVLNKQIINKDHVIGIISIFLDDLLSEGGLNCHYVVNFQARSVQWIYYLINRNQVKLTDPAICNQAKVFFDGPMQVILPNGEAAMSFSSGEMLFPLQQNPNTMFNLIDRLMLPQSFGKTVENCLIKGLPTPQKSQLKVRRTDTSSSLVGEMYIYV